MPIQVHRVHRVPLSGLVGFLLFLGPIDISRADTFTWDTTPSNNDWNNPLNWFGTAGQFPDGDLDSAIVNGSATTDPTLSESRTIGALTITAGGDVFTGDGANNYRLIVQNHGGLTGTTLIDGVSSTLTVYNTAFVLDAETDNLTVRNFGRLTLSGGPLYQVDNALSVGTDGEIFGFGTVNLAGTTNGVNNGLIRASGGVLRITASGTAKLDFDGANDEGRLAVNNNSTLLIDAPLTGPLFDGTITLNANSSLGVSHPWTLQGTLGTVLDMNGGTGAATVGGAGAWTVEGRVNVNSGVAVFATPTTIEGLGYVAMSGNTTLQFDATTSILVPERIQNGVGTGGTSFIVNRPVEIGTGTGYFDWDNSGGGDGTTTVNASGSMNIRVTAVDTVSELEEYGGTLILNSGSVSVDIADNSWDLTGELQMNNTASDVPILSGDAVVFHGPVKIGGSGVSLVDANARFSDTSAVTVTSGAYLSLANSSTVIAGGAWSGDGVVNLDGVTTTISEATTVNMPHGAFDLDGGTTGFDELVVNATARLNVNAVDDEGNTINDDIRISAFGRLDVNLTNSLASWTSAGTMTLTGLPGAFTTLHLDGSDIRLTGVTSVTGNSASAARLLMSGATSITAGGSMILRGGSETRPNVVESTATFSGAGDLIVAGGAAAGYLRLNDNAFVNVDVINQGHLEVGSSPGFARVATFTQSSTGTYEAEIDGATAVTQYDVLRSLGPAALDGTLEILVNDNGGIYADPTTPGTFDQFDLIDASAISGQFASVSYDGTTLALSFSGGGMDRFYVGAGLFRILDYDLAGFDLLNYRALPGDANGDGNVDGSDFGIWNSNKFTAGTDWTKGDFNGDGITDGTDFGIWNANKFTGINLGRPGALIGLLPEPSTNGMCLMGLILSLAGRRRRASSVPSQIV